MNIMRYSIYTRAESVKESQNYRVPMMAQRMHPEASGSQWSESVALDPF
jgi:hypothetical protein